jgi:arginyl-tRNA synthetase
MTNLAKSIYARIMQINSDQHYPFPEDGYHGHYVVSIAEELIAIYGNKLDYGSAEDMATIMKFGEEWCFNKIKATLSRMNINQDVYFNEDSLYKDGKIQEVINQLKENGYTYEKDGAL